MDLYAPWAVTPWQAVLGIVVVLLVCLAGSMAAWGRTLERWERESHEESLARVTVAVDAWTREEMARYANRSASTSDDNAAAGIS